jgi:hypothetical protein
MELKSKSIKDDYVINSDLHATADPINTRVVH